MRALTVKIGNELSEEDLDKALAAIDEDGNGVIDIYEFARWYFSGMKFENMHSTKLSITPEQI